MTSLEILGSETLGKAIAQRLALREEAANQVHVVDVIAKLPFLADLVLCGSAALHGCYLHGRRVQHLDFIARPEVAQRLVQGLRVAGIQFKQTQAHHEYAVAVNRGAIAGMPVKFRTHPRFALEVEAELLPFVQGKAQSAAIRIPRFPELVVAKLASLCLRERPLDYFDIWIVSKHGPNAGPEVRRLLASRRETGSSHTPASLLSTAFLMKRFTQMEPIWDESLAALVSDPPSFSNVKDDLNQWLPILDTHN